MHAEGLGRGRQRQSLDIFQDSHLGFRIGCIIDTTGRVLVRFSEGFGTDIRANDLFDQDFVLIVGDTAAIVDIGPQVLNDFERNMVIFIQEYLQLTFANHEIFVGEVVGNIPADRAKFAAFLNDGMEEAKAEEQFLEGFRILAIIEFFVIQVLEGA